MGDSEQEETQTNQSEIEQMDNYRTAPLRFPLHVLNEEGTPLCGSMAADQERFVERHGLDSQPTLREKQNDVKMMHFVSDLCGNCRRSLLSEDGTEKLQEAWEERRELEKQVTIT